MKKLLLTLFLFSCVLLLTAQTRPSLKKDTRTINDTTRLGSRKTTTNKNIKDEKAKIFDYKVISSRNDTTYVDTTLTIKKDYKYNYLRKYYFELLPFSNTGQTFNSLSYNYSSDKLMPIFGSRAKHFNYLEIEDVEYYHVPTPLTELFFKTVFEQGQLLDAFFTTNISKQFNFSVAYKGLRSLGKYQHILTSTGNVKFTANYKTKNDRYKARAHIYMQDILNEENGGLTDEEVLSFESGEEEFVDDRGVFDAQFQDAQSSLEGKRFFLDHSYALIQRKDSLTNNKLTIGNKLIFEDKYYHYTQSAASDFFGESFRNSDLSDRVTLEDFFAQANATYTNNILGTIMVNVDYNNFNYGYNKLVNLGDQSIINRLKGEVISVGGAYEKQFKKVKLDARLGANISGDFDGNYLLANAEFKIDSTNIVKASFNSSSKRPNYNTLLYQSDYVNYNWQNDFSNVETQQLALKLRSDKWFNADVDYTTIKNYTYFNQSQDDASVVRPLQYDSQVNYARVKVSKEIRLGKFALDNTLMYQKVLDGEGVLNVPDIITRNTLYYSNHFFKKALFLQTGVTFKYFTEYYMNAYNPLLGEFQVQTSQELGGFPLVDFFLNAKVQQTRIYLKAQHVNSAWTGYNYYSAPNYPYRDFNVRFGIVWNFFL